MSYLGISCNVIKTAFKVRAVELDDDGKASEVFVHTSNKHEDFALQLRNLATALETRIQDIPAEAAVVRCGDFHASRRLQAATLIRIRAEGVLLAVLRQQIAVVKVLSGRELGAELGSGRDDVDAKAKEILAGAFEATSAALAARHLHQKAS